MRRTSPSPPRSGLQQQPDGGNRSNTKAAAIGQAAPLQLNATATSAHIRGGHRHSSPSSSSPSSSNSFHKHRRHKHRRHKTHSGKHKHKKKHAKTKHTHKKKDKRHTAAAAVDNHHHHQDKGHHNTTTITTTAPHTQHTTIQDRINHKHANIQTDTHSNQQKIRVPATKQARQTSVRKEGTAAATAGAAARALTKHTHRSSSSSSSRKAKPRAGETTPGKPREDYSPYTITVASPQQSKQTHRLPPRLSQQHYLSLPSTAYEGDDDDSPYSPSAQPMTTTQPAAMAAGKDAKPSSFSDMCSQLLRVQQRWNQERHAILTAWAHADRQQRRRQQVLTSMLAMRTALASKERTAFVKQLAAGVQTRVRLEQRLQSQCLTQQQLLPETKSNSLASEQSLPHARRSCRKNAVARAKHARVRIVDVIMKRLQRRKQPFAAAAAGTGAPTDTAPEIASSASSQRVNEPTATASVRGEGTAVAVGSKAPGSDGIGALSPISENGQHHNSSYVDIEVSFDDDEDDDMEEVENVLRDMYSGHGSEEGPSEEDDRGDVPRLCTVHGTSVQPAAALKRARNVLSDGDGATREDLQVALGEVIDIATVLGKQRDMYEARARTAQARASSAEEEVYAALKDLQRLAQLPLVIANQTG